MNIHNTFCDELPGDMVEGGNPRQVMEAFSFVKPCPVQNPTIVAFNDSVAKSLDLGNLLINRSELVEILSGNKLLDHMKPYAVNYGGHQFGNWAGQLGDGRAITLFQTKGSGNQNWEVQLKGCGRTPYSRSGDGRAVLRSSIREFLCSEAMHHLGIPTTRALSLVKTGEKVVRDMFYDGNPREEDGAVVCRVAPTFLRFGNFELPSFRGNLELTRRLVDYSIKHYFPHLNTENGDSALNIYEKWFLEICEKTAYLVAQWMRVGFVHGVLNTDNMSILGLTIDYGPYGWLDNFDRNWTPNTTDLMESRYRFGAQPDVALWNLHKLGLATDFLFGSKNFIDDALEHYRKKFIESNSLLTAKKLGLDQIRKEDLPMVEDLYDLLEDSQMDMTNFFRVLSNINVDSPDAYAFDKVFYNASLKHLNNKRLTIWLDNYAKRIKNNTLDPQQREQIMKLNNPNFILRNYLSQNVIDQAERGDFSGISKLMDVIKLPYNEHPEWVDLFNKRPDWAVGKPGCSKLSCSS